MSELIDYFHENFNGIIKKSARELVDRAKNENHNHEASHDAVKAVEYISSHTGEGILFTNARLLGTVQQNWIDAINDGCKLAINPMNGVSYFTVPHNAEIEIVKKVTYSEKDITISKFNGGKHWYAKIGNMDVVDPEGNQKWNAKWVAKQKAIEFLKTL